MRKISPWASLLGHSYAHIQHGMDRVIAWGFQSMRKATEQSGKAATKTKKATASRLDTAKQTGISILRFIGQTGEAYFEKYEELKKNKKS
jgi:acetyl-CoA acetyltransferase